MGIIASALRENLRILKEADKRYMEELNTVLDELDELAANFENVDSED